MSLPQILLGLSATLSVWYLSRLAVRLRRSTASHSSRSNVNTFRNTLEELENVSYKGIDMLKVIPPATFAGYAVIGGSGFLGTYIVRLLIMRGETNIRILDINPPDTLDHPAVSFVKTDITSLESVRSALTAPFPATGGPPTVIFHTAAVIRFWERAAYCFDASYRVNVKGTENVLSAAKELPSVMVVYTSSADTILPGPKFLRIDWDSIPASVRDGNALPRHLHETCYPRSKRMAEQLVMNASLNEGLKTGILRPGNTILGPNDRLISSTLTMQQLPAWDQPWTSTNICVWDAAAAHLLYEDALRRSPEEVSGEAFLITGRGSPWNIEDIRTAIKHYATRELVFIELPPLLIFLMAHIIELFLFLRYIVLYPLALVSGGRPSLVPPWLGPAVFLQPGTLDVQLCDNIIDDSRARKVLGYQPQWDTAQAIRYSVDEIQSGNAAADHGLKA
ncbi:hypothetical protein GGX14DRAFT_665342 [Mycena pura]|uniref:3-beta hydroxysteroid dehydrogenase/isomerase domain-containing protein n=1 Tax=Mycena pura TaxID=153505 RepID=A0AAD6Y4G7_9AGAR|nr:hypothetical protein GGX14DRAFT_665342 [Mycena pura]